MRQNDDAFVYAYAPSQNWFDTNCTHQILDYLTLSSDAAIELAQNDMLFKASNKALFSTCAKEFCGQHVFQYSLCI